MAYIFWKNAFYIKVQFGADSGKLHGEKLRKVIEVT